MLTMRLIRKLKPSGDLPERGGLHGISARPLSATRAFPLYERPRLKFILSYIQVLKWPEIPTNSIRPTDSMRSSTHGPISFEANLQDMFSFDELWARLGGDRIDISLALRKELEMASNYRHHKRLRTAEMADSESGDRGSAEPPNGRSRKKRKVTMERETEDRVAAQRGETHELRARRTSGQKENISKLGNRGLGRRHLRHHRKELIVLSHRG